MIPWGWLVAAAAGGACFGYLAAALASMARSGDRVREAMAEHSAFVDIELTHMETQLARDPAFQDPGPRCRCRHPKEAHRHFRPGRDCGICGPLFCAKFTPEDQR